MKLVGVVFNDAFFIDEESEYERRHFYNIHS